MVMQDNTPPLAKLNRPKLFNALHRLRLFEALDKARQRPIVWVSAAPGAGKTTLVSSYVEARKLDGLWFQIDASDADPATLLYYLGIAAERMKGGARPTLPARSPRQSDDWPMFTRKFFRALFACFPKPAVLVFDNYQELDPHAAIHRLLSVGLDEAPLCANVFVISRSQPTAAFSRLLASERLHVLDGSALRLTLDETRMIAHAKAVLDERTVNLLHEQVQGWAAGLTLMLEPGSHTAALHGELPQGSTEHVFDYFAGEVFDQLPAQLTRLLLRTAGFPRFSIRMAEEISGDTKAGYLLDQLFRRHLFIDRRHGTEAMYQYHDLFRAFLNHRAALTLSSEERQCNSLTSASILEANGFAEQAFDHYVQCGALRQAARLAIEHAPTLIGQARHQSVLDWMGRIARESVMTCHGCTTGAARRWQH